MRSYVLVRLACASLCLASGLASAAPGGPPPGKGRGWDRNHSAPAPLLAAGVPGALTIVAAGAASYLRHVRKKRKVC
jgi:hypothetical protein